MITKAISINTIDSQSIKIQLSQGYYAIVDANQFEKINAYKWTFHRGKAVRTAKVSEGQYPKEIRLDKFILGVTNSKETVYHLNGNLLDCRVNNLRLESNITDEERLYAKKNKLKKKISNNNISQNDSISDDSIQNDLISNNIISNKLSLNDLTLNDSSLNDSVNFISNDSNSDYIELNTLKTINNTDISIDTVVDTSINTAVGANTPSGLYGVLRSLDNTKKRTNKNVSKEDKTAYWKSRVQKTINGKKLFFAHLAPYTEEGKYECALFYNFVSKILLGDKAKQNIIPEKYLNLVSEEQYKKWEQNIQNKIQKYSK